MLTHIDTSWKMIGKILRHFEIIIVLAVLVGIVAFAYESFNVLIHMDWAESDTYFLLLRRILALAIGVELIRFIQTFDINTLLEILIFLMARQIILMEMNEHYEYLIDVVIGTAIFIGLRIALKWTPREVKNKP